MGEIDTGERQMTKSGINRETDESGELQIGPTSQGMVRLFVRAGSFDLPMDFTPDEAEEIAAELTDAALRARVAANGEPAGHAPPPENTKNPRSKRKNRRRKTN